MIKSSWVWKKVLEGQGRCRSNSTLCKLASPQVTEHEQTERPNYIAQYLLREEKLLLIMNYRVVDLKQSKSKFLCVCTPMCKC